MKCAQSYSNLDHYSPETLIFDHIKIMENVRKLLHLFTFRYFAKSFLENWYISVCERHRRGNLYNGHIDKCNRTFLFRERMEDVKCSMIDRIICWYLYTFISVERQGDFHFMEVWWQIRSSWTSLKRATIIFRWDKVESFFTIAETQ